PKVPSRRCAGTSSSNKGPYGSWHVLEFSATQKISATKRSGLLWVLRLARDLAFAPGTSKNTIDLQNVDLIFHSLFPNLMSSFTHCAHLRGYMRNRRRQEFGSLVDHPPIEGGLSRYESRLAHRRDILPESVDGRSAPARRYRDLV